MLSIDDIVRINVNVIASATALGAFDTGLILAPLGSNFNESKRLITYTSASEAISGLIDMGYDAEDQVYRYAVKYFGVEHTPRRLMVSFYPLEPTAETPAQALEKVLQRTQDFFGVCVAGVSDPEPLLDLEEAIRTAGKPAVLFLPIPNPADYAVDETGIMYKMYERGTDRCACMYCNQPSDAAAAMGEMMGLVSARNDSSFQMCFRGLTGVTPQNLTASEVDAIQALNGNVYITRGRDHQVFEKGTVASGRRLEEVLYVDMIASELQTALLNLIVNSPVKLPQTDSTTDLFISECNQVLERYYNRTILATQPWRSAGIGGVAKGDIIEHGYVCMADSFDTQTDADRAAHKAMPITILLCLSGSVESVEITLYVQQ